MAARFSSKCGVSAVFRDRKKSSKIDSYIFSTDRVENVLWLQRYWASLFRLSYRYSNNMQYKDWERSVVVDFIQSSFRFTRDLIEKEQRRSARSKYLAETLGRMQKWRERQEL